MMINVVCKYNKPKDMENMHTIVMTRVFLCGTSKLVAHDFDLYYAGVLRTMYMKGIGGPEEHNMIILLI